jgi:DNA-binding MarR family transcriptional regulator
MTTPRHSVEHCNCVSLRRASRRISLFYDACLAPSGLRATQFAMLAALSRAGELSVQALGQMLDMDRSTAGQTVKLLERDGLLALARSGSDGRSRLIRLTAQGQERLALALPLWQQAQSRIEADNGADTMAMLRSMLAALKVPDATAPG